MNLKRRDFLDAAIRTVGLAIALALLVPMAAGAQYLDDGAKQNANGGWDLPNKGACYPDANTNGITTRPECVATRFPTYDATTCPAAQGSWAANTNVCVDMTLDVNTCVSAAPSVNFPKGIHRKWTGGVCALSMKGYDRNVAVCVGQGGSYLPVSGVCLGNWVMPAAGTFTPPLLTGTGPGDQCLRCHRSDTEWNSTRIRDVETALQMGHKNMARKANPSDSLGWGGPPLDANHDPLNLYPSDDGGNAFNWPGHQINLSTGSTGLYWIYGDWMAPLPRAIYNAGSNATTGKPLMSYSCARCHTTGWTSDLTINALKEPEKTFPGVTWDGTTMGTTGKVNLAGGVTGDANKYASWDVWGIGCTRCHNSAVNKTGQSSHHNNLTSADNGSGICTDKRFTSESACTGNSGIWLTACSVSPNPALCTEAANTEAKCVATSPAGVWVNAGFCSNNTSYTTQADCTSNGFTWQTGWCKRPDIAASGSCTGGSGDAALTWRTNGSQAACQAAGATWAFSSCSIPATCSKAGFTDYAACTGAGGTWTSLTSEFPCIDAGGTYTGNNKTRGQGITAVCMDCHRQEAGGLPMNASNPGGVLTVGPAHGTVAPISHAGGNEFLNSPHGRFSGTFAQIGTARSGSGYASYFQNDSEAKGTGAGCTTCHNVHLSMVEGTGHAEAVKTCQDCHKGQYGIDLTKIKHPAVAGTPFEHMVAEPFEACVTCHMPEGMHLWRVNPSASYSTYPAGAVNGNVAANTSPEGTFTNAVWTDLDATCGQCHGGGTSYATTAITTGTTATLSVASTNGFTAGSRVRIAGVGALESNGSTREDFDSYIKTVTPPATIVLVGAPTASASGKTLVQNPLEYGGHYRSKVELASFALGMHTDHAPAANGVVASFTFTPSGFTVNVDAAASTCTGGAVNCDSYTWDFGDGATATGKTQSHLYAAGGTYAIRLTVVDTGIGQASVTKSVTVRGAGPVADGVCSFNAQTWLMTVTNTSTAPNGLKLVAVDWNQGLLSRDFTAPFDGPFTHTYLVPSTYKVYLRAIDKTGISNRKLICTTAPAQFTLWSITGTVRDAASAALGGAKVEVKGVGSRYLRNVFTAANGTYSVPNLRPGAYTLTVSKTGYTFPAGVDVTVGGNQVNDVNAQ